MGSTFGVSFEWLGGGTGMVQGDSTGALLGQCLQNALALRSLQEGLKGKDMFKVSQDGCSLAPRIPRKHWRTFRSLYENKIHTDNSRDLLFSSTLPILP